MNDTRVIQTNTRSDVRAFVARVRVALSDLPDDDADELTQGMEADLVELAAEAGGLRGRLGTPETYADDLRAAADLPPRRPAPTRGRRRLRTRVAGWWARGEGLMDRAWVRDLRPVGWALRGVVAYCVAASVIGANPHSLLGWLVGASFLVLGRPLNPHVGEPAAHASHHGQRAGRPDRGLCGAERFRSDLQRHRVRRSTDHDRRAGG